MEVGARPAPTSVFTPLTPTRVNTAAVWLIAVLPVLVVAGQHATTVLIVDQSISTVRIAAASAFLVLTVLCALRDQHLLRTGGHTDTASPAWVLLTPFAYLVARTVRVRRETGVRSSTPTLLWLGLMLPAVAITTGWLTVDRVAGFF